MTLKKLLEDVGNKYDLIFAIDNFGKPVFGTEDPKWEEYSFVIVQNADDARYYATFILEDPYMLIDIVTYLTMLLNMRGEDLSRDKELTLSDMYDIDNLTSDMSLVGLYSKLKFMKKGFGY